MAHELRVAELRDRKREMKDDRKPRCFGVQLSKICRKMNIGIGIGNYLTVFYQYTLCVKRPR